MNGKKRGVMLASLSKVIVLLLPLLVFYNVGAQNPPATVVVATDPTLGSYLVDAQGKTLYIFLNDIHLASHCYDQCAETWPPLELKGKLVAGPGVNARLLGSFVRDDGTTQVTYNRYPLYLHTDDTEPGMMTGQDIADTWYIISPEGYRVASGTENSN